MRHLIAIAIATSTGLAGCGVETATTAATVAAARKQELERGRQRLERVQRRIETAMEQSRQRAQRNEDAAR